MARLNTQTYDRAVASAARRQHAAARRGYLDAARRQPFSQWYEDAGQVEQLAYEVGRHWATNMLCAGLAPPPWPHGLPPPPAVTTANEEAARRGEKYATPWGVWPDTDDPVLLEPGSNEPPGRRWRRRRR